MGHGCVDATAALKIDVSNLHPFTLKSNQVTDNTLIFSVSSSMAGNGELTLYNGIGNKVLSLHLELEAASLHSVDITKLSRSEERRVGKECLRLCRSRWSPYH